MAKTNMSKQTKLIRQIRQNIVQEQAVYLLHDFAGAETDELRQAIMWLVDNLELIEIAPDMYTPSRVNRLTRKVMPSHSLDSIVIAVLERHRVPYEFYGLTKTYLEGKANQIPAKMQIRTFEKLPFTIAVNGEDITPTYKS
ncbi:hypothetical protein LRP52_43920 [Photobacterium sp. ZSDE20]|uniref:Uncharacterized protein n=1 Tax=Photobacterium pectinilyticum TaxID=2906793 RepID=A0ABT1N8F4_9GAMM|nr:hypothetical protein [Photobacterium sp. ZSDE20]MCQ1061027.1 hypothetical protein [Photobacterium sp. ZSDE20]MDD1829119.1 hypothetical protein [Photobacterium sp. ZSDE20]